MAATAPSCSDTENGRTPVVVAMWAKRIGLLLLLLVLGAQSLPLEVIKLTGNTFEHQTQASTGQTTGQWCVLFANSSSSSHQELIAENAWEQLAAVEDKPAIVAKVDVATAAGLAKRFSISSTPAVILFRDRAMYPFSISSSVLSDAHKLAAAVEAFIDGGYEQQEARAVPAEPSAVSMLMELASFLEVQPNWFFYSGVICLGIGVLLFLGFFGAGVWYALPDKKVKQQPAAAGPAAADVAGVAGVAGDGEVPEGTGAKPAATRVTRRRA